MRSKTVGGGRARTAGRFLCCMLSTAACLFSRQVNVVSFGDLVQAFRPCMGLLPAALLGCVGCLASGQSRIARVRRNERWALCSAVVFSQCWWWGFRCDGFDSLFVPSPFFALQYAVVSAGLIYLFYLIVSCLLDFCAGSVNVVETAGRGTAGPLLPFVLCMCVWSVYYFLFYPGIVTQDSYYQVTQALGFVPLTNEHPFLHTLLEAVFLKPAYLFFDDIELGIGWFILFQMAVMALIVAYVNVLLHRMGISKGVRTAVVLFYCLHPLAGMYAVTMWKDIWMAMLLLFYLLVIIRILYLRDSSRFVWCQFTAAALGVLFAKGTGVIMIGFSALAMLPLFRRQRKLCLKLLCLTVLSVLLWSGIQNIAFARFGVTPGHIRETKSVPLQQIARVVSRHGAELSPQERAAIDEILPCDRLPVLYNPRISDAVKAQLNEEAYQADPGRYIRLWLKLGRQFPMTYVSSLLYNSYGYWYPEADYWMFTSDSYQANLQDCMRRGRFVGDKNADRYDFSESGFARREKISVLVTSLRYLPGISMLFSIGGYFWGFFLMGALLFLRRDRRMLIPLSLALGVFISCVMSPVYAEMRYAYPAILIFPIALVLSLFPQREYGLP